MKITILLSVTLMFSYCGFSQQVSPQLLSTSGGTISNSQYLFDWAVGELEIETVYGGFNNFTQGFHQPNYFLVSLLEISPFSIQVFPNPASDKLFIQSNASVKLKYKLTDLNGKLLMVRTFLGIAELNLSNLSKGIYFLDITDKDLHTLKIFRVLKTQ